MTGLVDSGSDEPAGRRRAVLRVLRSSPAPLSIVAIAQQLDVHPNTVRFHLDSLVGTGQAERATPAHRGPGRPPLMFQAVRQMDRGGARHYRLLSEILTMGLASEPDFRAKAVSIGRAWGEQLPAPAAPQDPASSAEWIERLVDVLDDMGFDPELLVSGGKARVGLRHCPFLELAEAQSSVVCLIHLGIMRGALESWGAPVGVDGLEPFAEPDVCLAHLTLDGTPL